MGGITDHQNANGEPIRDVMDLGVLLPGTSEKVSAQKSGRPVQRGLGYRGGIEGLRGVGVVP